MDFIDCLIACLLACLLAWLIDWLIDWLVDLFIYSFVYLFIDVLIDWWVEWFIDAIDSIGGAPPGGMLAFFYVYILLVTLGWIWSRFGIIFEVWELLLPPRRSEATPSSCQSRLGEITRARKYSNWISKILIFWKTKNVRRRCRQKTRKKREQRPPQTIDFKGFAREGLQKP